MTRRAKYFTLAVMFFALAMLVAPAVFADNRSGDDLTNVLENDNSALAEVGDIVGGSNTSKSLALASSLGDVDIAQCLASTQFTILIFGKQGVKLNEWCAALWYDQQGLHELAAGLRCNYSEIAGEFDSDAECVIGNTLTGFQEPTGTTPPPATSQPGAPAAVAEVDLEVQDEDEDESHDHDRAIAQLRQEFEADQVARRRASQRAAAKRAEQAQAEAQAIDEFLYSYEQLTEQAQQIEEPPTATEEPPANEQ